MPQKGGPDLEPQRDYGAVVNQHGLQLLFDLVIALVRGLGLVAVASPTQAVNHEVSYLKIDRYGLAFLGQGARHN